MDLSISCRLCFKDKGSDYVNIFTDPLRNYPLQVNEMFQTELMDLPHWPNSACRNCVAKLDDLLLFKETVLSTQLQIQEETNRNIKTEKEPTNGAAYVETYWCPTPGVSHAKKEESLAESDAIEKEDEDESVKEESSGSETQYSDLGDESEESEEERKQGGKKKNQDKPRKKVTKEEKLLNSFKRAAQKSHPKDVLIIEEMRRRNLLVCSICDAVGYENMFYLFVHMMEVHNTRGFITCCDRRLASKLNAYSHMRAHLEPDTFKCEHCNQRFHNAINRRQHTMRHHTAVEIKCGTCGKTCKTKESLKRHTVSHLPLEQRPFKCTHDQCNRAYGVAYQLRDHVDRMHNVQNNFVCDVCGKGFTTNAILTTHKRSLHDEAVRDNLRQKNNALHPCQKCGKLIALIGMKKHLSLACPANAKNLLPLVPCTLCGKKIKGDYLNAHMKTACPANGNRYFCSVCNKECKSAKSLSAHVRVHDPNWSLAYKWKK